jgi:hypothetical protein
VTEHQAPRGGDAGRTRRRRLRVWIVLLVSYVVLAAATTVTSRRLDARQKFPTGLTRTLYDRSSAEERVLSRQVVPDIDLAFIDRDPALPRRFFGVRWDGFWHRETSGWTDLYAGADDRVTIKLDDAVVFERNVLNRNPERRARIMVRAGTHHLEVSYEQDGGDYLLYVSAGPANGVPESLDPESLFPRRPPARRLRANHNLLLLRRAVVGTWVVPPILALCALVFPGALRVSRRGARDWRRRNVDGIRSLFAGASQTGPAVTPVRVRPLFGAAAAIVAVLFLAAIWRFHDPVNGFTSLIAFGEQFEEQSMPELRQMPHQIVANSGYDGQFYAQLALDPMLHSAGIRVALDSLPYRSRRILLPWTAYLLGLGHPSWIINVYAVQNVLFWLLLGWVLFRWIPPVNLRNWAAWCGCLLGHGAISSVRLALTDLPGTALMALGLALAEQGRPLLAGAVTGLSGLARETSLAAAVGIDWIRSWFRSGPARTLLMAVLVIAPLALWLVYMRFTIGPRALSNDGSPFVMPLTGVADYVARANRDLQFDGWRSPVIPGLLALASLAVQGLYLVWRCDWTDGWWRVGIVYVALFALLPFPVFDGSPGAFVRVLLPMTVAFNVLIVRSRWFWLLFVAGNLTVLQGLQTIPLIPW